MSKKRFYLAALLLLCNSCVSRTTYKEPGLKGQSGRPSSEKKIVWIWDKDF